MIAYASSEKSRTRGRRWPALLLAASLALGAEARATLGEPAVSVLHDQAVLRATAITRTAWPGYAVQSMTTADGALVREYVSAQGTVFAVAWSGPSLPDLKVLLGTRFRHYAAATLASTGASKTLAIASAPLLLRVVKLPRGLEGAAIAPSLVPPGARIAELF